MFSNTFSPLQRAIGWAFILVLGYQTVTAVTSQLSYNAYKANENRQEYYYAPDVPSQQEHEALMLKGQQDLQQLQQRLEQYN